MSREGSHRACQPESPASLFSAPQPSAIREAAHSTMPLLLVLLVVLAACTRERQPAAHGTEQPPVTGTPSASHEGSLPMLTPEMVSPWFARIDPRLQPLLPPPHPLTLTLPPDP